MVYNTPTYNYLLYYFSKMNKLVKVVGSLFLSLAMFAGVTSGVLAIDVPDFPSCSNPQGVVKASYSSGTHGIVGSTATYTGTDIVYQLDNGDVLQCFCSESGLGIQTNWWKASSLDQSQVQTLINLGWYFVPDGTAWGLSEGFYLAQNINYSCGGTTTTTTSTSGASAPECKAERPNAPVLQSVTKNGTKATITWSKVEKATHYTIAYGTKLGDYTFGVPNTGNVTNYTIEALDPTKTYYFVVYAVNDCMPSNPGTLGGGQVLGLATTGTSLEILFYITSGLTFLGAGYLLRKTS